MGPAFQPVPHQRMTPPGRVDDQRTSAYNGRPLAIGRAITRYALPAEPGWHTSVGNG